MKTLLITTISLLIFSSLIVAQAPVTQVEGFLEVIPVNDISSLYIGRSAGQKAFPKGTANNTFVGSLSGVENRDGFANSFFGSSSGKSNTTGSRNSFFGDRAGRENTTGSRNSFFGYAAGGLFTEGVANNTGSDNTFIGREAGLLNTAGSNNTFIGSQAGFNISSQSHVVALGANAGPTSSSAKDSTLYIDIEESANPLIYGEFDNDLLRINGTLQLGAQLYDVNSLSTLGDDGVIKSPELTLSDLFLVANNNVIVEIGDDSLFPIGNFEIWNGEKDSIIFTVDMNGDVTAKAFYGTSDVNRKESFAPINTTNVLDKITNLSITEWQYKGSTDRHIGPMAQDFYAAFGLGQGETTIATVDADGVALAAIKALAEKNEKLEKDNQQQQAEINNLKEGLLRLEKLITESN